VLPTSVYLESSQFKDGELADDTARVALGDLVATLLDLAAAPKHSLRPPPLASGRG
jgi:hypothetical protein